jgi:hypothetical protein
MLLLSTCVSVAAPVASAQHHAFRHIGGPRAVCIALAPVVPPVTPQVDNAGSHGLRLRMQYLENVTGNVELRRHQYFIDDNLKTERPRTSIAWYVRWYF